jgi:SRSO17 transposase
MVSIPVEIGTVMDDHVSGARAERFAAYMSSIAEVLGDPRRRGPMTSYCTGLLMPADRKSVEPMAALTAPERTAAQHQSLLHFVGKGEWSDADVLEKVREHVVPAMEQHGAISAWIIDDTGFPKKGRHSVGVARQYCGQLGKQDNCQVAVSLSIANDHASLPIAYALYLPESWVADRARRDKAGVPADVTFKTKPEIALEQIAWAMRAGVPRGDVIADAGYGCETRFRTQLTELGLRYIVGIKSTNAAWTDVDTGGGTIAMRMSVEKIALALGDDAWRTVSWREGTNETLNGRFARLRVRGDSEGAEEWLLIEWPQDETKPTKFWYSTLRANISFAHLVSRAKSRWRIERDYLELKQEIGLGHFEGRGWRGFHHHATLCIAAYGFLISERAAFSPSETVGPGIFEAPRLPKDHAPRGASLANSSPCAGQHRNRAV